MPYKKVHASDFVGSAEPKVDEPKEQTAPEVPAQPVQPQPVQDVKPFEPKPFDSAQGPRPFRPMNNQFQRPQQQYDNGGITQPAMQALQGPT
ncbi:MAG TPA: hypothetical protein VEW42_05330, partial [Candidatus Eisenbacteria bacterium]|nr:hypothetical protein [Candidatus Eisenbacteria bacterium]